MKKQNTYEYLDNLGIDEFIKVLLELIEKAFLDSFVKVEDNVDEAVSSKDILGYITRVSRFIDNTKQTKLSDLQYELDELHNEVVYDSNVFTHLKVKLTIQSLDDIRDPRDDILYLQQSSINPNVWNLCVYTNDEWRVVGEGNYELHNYYSKNDPEFENKVLDICVQRMTFDDIKRAVFEAAMDVGMLDTRILAHLGLYTFE